MTELAAIKDLRRLGHLDGTGDGRGEHRRCFRHRRLCEPLDGQRLTRRRTYDGARRRRAFGSLSAAPTAERSEPPGFGVI